MAEIGKGRIMQISGAVALLEDSETASLKKAVSIPARLADSLAVGDTAAYIYFNDMTGVIVEKLGGD